MLQTDIYGMVIPVVRRRKPMVTVMYRWRIHPDQRDEFRQHWEKIVDIDEDEQEQLSQSKLFFAGKDVLIMNEFKDGRDAATWSSKVDWQRFNAHWAHERLAGPENLSLIAWAGSETLEAKNGLTIAAIQEAVAEYFGVSKRKLISKARQADVAFPRHLAMWMCRKFTPKSYPEIGAKFGGRDHTSVAHSYKRIRKLLREGFVFLDRGKEYVRYANESFDGRSLSDVVDEIKVKLGLPIQIT